jgi:hypothetical protein
MELLERNNNVVNKPLKVAAPFVVPVTDGRNTQVGKSR